MALAQAEALPHRLGVELLHTDALLLLVPVGEEERERVTLVVALRHRVLVPEREAQGVALGLPLPLGLPLRLPDWLGEGVAVAVRHCDGVAVPEPPPLADRLREGLLLCEGERDTVPDTVRQWLPEREAVGLELRDTVPLRERDPEGLEVELSEVLDALEDEAEAE